MSAQLKSTIRSLLKSCIFVTILAMAINVCEARVAVGIGFGGGYYGAPYSDVEWIPGHWEDGFWVPGHYVETSDYYDYGFGPEVFIGGYGGGGHFHGGHGGFHGGFHGGGGHGGGHRR